MFFKMSLMVLMDIQRCYLLALASKCYFISMTLEDNWKPFIHASLYLCWWLVFSICKNFKVLLLLLAQGPHYKKLDKESKDAVVSRIHLLTDDIHSEISWKWNRHGSVVKSRSSQMSIHKDPAIQVHMALPSVPLPTFFCQKCIER